MSTAAALTPINPPIPTHVAIIMDGNGRWAGQRNLPRTEGHRKGSENSLHILEAAGKIGVRYLTLYAFSVENWHRPADEVDALMRLLETYLDRYYDKLVEKKIRLRTIGDTAALPAHAREPLEKAIRDTAHFTGTSLVLALNYGSRNEVLRALRTCANDIASGQLNPDKLDWNAFASYLDTRDIPDPDLVIRTSGETRMSNFLLLQSAYAEWYFTPTLWPDFDENCFIEAVRVFSTRERRFGRTAEQLSPNRPKKPPQKIAEIS
ncbi:MAG: isoprenyl transferase [Puniceicoccales bacterium]|jgi:undecaprenyl diphosphate synthase|nr:isoprenyl transferase [Puniceicoccales bacterium]